MINKPHLLLGGYLLHDLEVGPDVPIVHVSCVHALSVFIGYGRNQNYRAAVLPLKALDLMVSKVFGESLAKGRQTLFACKRLIVTEGCQYEVRLHGRQVLFAVGEVGWPGLQVDFIGGPGKVAHDKGFVRVGLLDECLQMSEFMHPVEQGVAD